MYAHEVKEVWEGGGGYSSPSLYLHREGFRSAVRQKTETLDAGVCLWPTRSQAETHWIVCGGDWSLNILRPEQINPRENGRDSLKFNGTKRIMEMERDSFYIFFLRFFTILHWMFWKGIRKIDDMVCVEWYYLILLQRCFLNF